MARVNLTRRLRRLITCQDSAVSGGCDPEVWHRPDNEAEAPRSTLSQVSSSFNSSLLPRCFSFTTSLLLDLSSSSLLLRSDQLVLYFTKLPLYSPPKEDTFSLGARASRFLAFEPPILPPNPGLRGHHVLYAQRQLHGCLPHWAIHSLL